jgi:hypothetical protein
MKVSGEHMPVDCNGAVNYFSRLTRKLHLPQLHLARDAFERGDHQRALWHYMVASEGGYFLGSLNAMWLISRGCAPLTYRLGACPCRRSAKCTLHVCVDTISTRSLKFWAGPCMKLTVLHDLLCLRAHTTQS